MEKKKYLKAILYDNGNNNIGKESYLPLINKAKNEMNPFDNVFQSLKQTGRTTRQFYQNFKLNQSHIINGIVAKPWFMLNGTIQASKYYPNLALWPEEMIMDNNNMAMNDRIVNQLMFIPKHYDENDFVPFGKKSLKTILIAHKKGWNDVPLGRRQFLNDKCPVNACFILSNSKLINQADAVIFKDRFSWPRFGRTSSKQLWILFLLESPHNTQSFSSLPANVLNWTATYRHDSDIVTPYEKFVSYESIFDDYLQKFYLNNINDNKLTNYARGKTKKVAWFVSNCGAKNRRLEYARELSKFIDVDIYGSCGNLKCSRKNSKHCFHILNRDYKFYLAFENSNCRDYITEKFFTNGLGHNDKEMDVNVVPIVLGAHRDDYERVSPKHSFIHVDDFRSPAHLARYLHYLDENDDAYNRYFDWKTGPKEGEFINTYFWCRLCTLLHVNDERTKPFSSYANIDQWWAPKGICNDSSIRNRKLIK